MYYCAYDNDTNLIAFHDKKYIVENYIDKVNMLHKIQLNMGVINNESEYKLEKYDDLYLVRYGDVYIQSGYLVYAQLSFSQLIDDDQQAIDTLYRILETSNLSSKENKKIKKAIVVMEKIVKENREYIPTLDNLKRLKEHYDPYIYNVGMLDDGHW